MVARLILVLALLVNIETSFAATVQASVDRNPVAVSESFQLQFDTKSSPDEDPDFSPLETFFDILHQSSSNRVQIINGKMERAYQWQLTMMARAPGNYTIPAITFGKDRSNPIALTIEKDKAAAAGTDAPVFLEVEIAPEKAYVQSQILYTVRLLRSVNIQNASLSEPDISGVEAIVEKLGDDKSFETLRNGVRYVVLERRYSLFPQAAGTLTLAPIVFQGQVLRGNRFTFNSRAQSKRVQSEGRKVEVQPIPANATRPWLPATELRLNEEWPQDPPQFTVGEPVTRTVTIMAAGVAGAQLPTLSTTLPDGLKQYPDQPVTQDQLQGKGLIGVRQEKIAIMPTRSGRFTLPAVEVPWWNINSSRQEVARLPARTINVQAAAGEPVAPTPITSTALPPVNENVVVTTVERISAGYWPWLSLLLALGWLGTGVLWWISRKPARSTVAPRKPRAAFRDVTKTAEENNPQACKQALLVWARHQWPEQPPTSLGAISARVDTDFSDALTQLSQVLYAQSNGQWNGSTLAKAGAAWFKQTQESTNAQASDIAPLYPKGEAVS